MSYAVVCFAKCWACQFGDCPTEPHTWMDEDDMDSAKVAVPSSPEGWERLAVEKPCGCRCLSEFRATLAERKAAEGGGRDE